MAIIGSLASAMFMELWTEKLLIRSRAGPKRCGLS